MEHQLYKIVLYLAGSINVILAAVLLYNNLWFRNYDVYRRARQMVALCYVIFAIGFFMHAYFEWRTSWPEGASALSVSYFHAGGLLFGWSYISLMRPDYLTRRVSARDLIVFVVGLISYWTTVLVPLAIYNLQFTIFFAHTAFIAYTLYHTYFTVRLDVMKQPTDVGAPSWWTPEAKRTVLSGQHAFMIASHLIVLFGIGGIVVTAAFPTQLAPFTLLMTLGIVVFCYIFYALTEYGNAIEAATCVTEDITYNK